MKESIFKKAVTRREQRNEVSIEVGKEDFKNVCIALSTDEHALLRLMFATDERRKDGFFRIYAVFSIPGIDVFYLIVLPVAEHENGFPSLTSSIPSAHWYEREIRDMFGLNPQGHPDARRLVFHEAFPAGSRIRNSKHGARGLR
jgi:Ni,Fe-hydrogenase III component G